MKTRFEIRKEFAKNKIRFKKRKKRIDYSNLTDLQIEKLSQEYIEYIKGRNKKNPLYPYDPQKCQKVKVSIPVLEIIVEEDLRCFRNLIHQTKLEIQKK